jgi:septum formation protein
MAGEPRIVLASGSPRRRQLLGLIGLRYRVRPSDIDETHRPGEEPAAFALRAACEKALAAAPHEPHLPVLAADTVVELAGSVLGKPSSTRHAMAMLRRLSGRTHRVHTGVALAYNGRLETLVDTAMVRFQQLTDDMVNWYVATGEPMDKAGAYAVQGAGGILVAGVDGSPQTVVGLPIHRLPELYAAHGLDFWEAITP